MYLVVKDAGKTRTFRYKVSHHNATDGGSGEVGQCPVSSHGSILDYT